MNAKYEPDSSKSLKIMCLSTSLRRVILLHSSSLLILRGVERWLLEVAKRFTKYGIRVLIVTFQLHLEEYKMDDLPIRLKLIKLYLKGSRWFELQSLSYRSIPNILRPVARFMKHSGIFFALPSKRLYQISKMISGVSSYIIVGDAFQALISSFMVSILGARRIVLGLHSRPAYKRFLYVSPFLRVFHKLGFLKGIHTVNLADWFTLRQMLKGIPVYFIPNGVDCRKFRPRHDKRKDVFQVLFVGALSEDKGIDLVIKIAELLKQKVQDIELVIASTGGPFEDDVKRATESGTVRYMGFVGDEDLVKLYSESHVCLFPSRDEAFGLVALEAQASGTPVICSNVSGFKQNVINGKTGIIVANYEPMEFMKAILNLYTLWKNHKEEYDQMCINARKHVLNKFNWDNVMDQLVKLIVS